MTPDATAAAEPPGAAAAAADSWPFRITPEHVAVALERIVVHSRHARARPRAPDGLAGGADAWIRPLLDSLPAPVYATDANGWVTYYNKAAVQFAGRTPLIGKDRWSIVARQYAPDGSPIAAGDCPMATALREDRPVRGVEAIGERPDGSRVPFAPYPTPIRDSEGRLVGAVNVLIDISARKRAEAEVAHLASHDPLTGLPNLATFGERLEEVLAVRATSRAPFAVMELDLLGFRHINDSLGHAAGDAVLRAVAGRLADAGGGLFLARIGADRFAVIVPAAESRARLRALAVELREAVRAGRAQPMRSDISLAVGCALYPADGSDATSLLAHAASALYQAKARPDEPVAFYDADADIARRERLALKSELRRAIACDELRLDYQPQTARDGSVPAFEALVRWHHPVRGVIAPGSFIPLAEEDDAIVAMSRWVLAEACREAARWPAGQRVSVNVSPVEFRRGDLPAIVAGVLAATGLAPDRLELEITEGVMVDGFDNAMAVLQGLRGLGVRIALDDFGTGYSSLSYLQAFPFSKLKIDRSFTENLGRVEKSAAIIRAVVGLGHALGLEVAAEGIESREQLDFLLAEGCDLFQGYFTGRPAPAAAYARLTGLAPGEPCEGKGLRKA